MKNIIISLQFTSGRSVRIIDYKPDNKDLNGLSIRSFSKNLKGIQDQKKRIKDLTPKRLHNFSMYIDGIWYSLTAKKGHIMTVDPIGISGM